MKAQVIFYGAGEFAQIKMREWLDKGLVPVCFADGDIKKHYTRFDSPELEALGVGDILPLREAIEKYPNYCLYVTVTHISLLKVTEYLIENGIPKDRIKYPDPVELRLGCEFLGYAGILSKNQISVCCHPDFGEKFSSDEKGFNEFLEFSKNKIEEFKAGITKQCEGCTFMKKSYWLSKPLYNCFTVATGFLGKHCSFKCIYCGTYDKPIETFDGTLLPAITIITKFLSKYGVKYPAITFSTEELGLFPDHKEVLQLLTTQGFDASFLLTGSIFMEGIVALKKSGRYANVNISLDAGTAETFKKIKQVALFDKVIGNIASYYNGGVKVTLKYIFLEDINDNETDVDGFVQIAKHYAYDAIISINNRSRDKRAKEKTIEMVCRMAKMLNESGIRFVVQYHFFNSGDVALVKSLI